MTSPEFPDQPLPLLARVAPASAASPADVARLRAALPARSRARRTTRVVAGGAALASAAAAALLAVQLGAPPAAPTAAAPVALAATFTAEAPLAHPTEVSPGVRMTATGKGTLSGTSAAPRLAWSAGAVELEVQPGAGIDLRVETKEAEVRVVGTVFSVDRSPLGTTVGVTRGKVAVDCKTGGAGMLTAGETRTCWPTTPGGLLGRARALAGAEALAATVLATVDAGLGAAPASGPIHDELAVLRIQQLDRADRRPEAIAAARAHLASGTPLRRAEVALLGARMVAPTATDASGCEEARPFLAAVSESATLPSDLAPLARRCAAQP